MRVQPLSFTLAVIPPFSLALTARVLQRIPTNRIDRFDAGVYQRLLRVGERVEVVSVSQQGDVDHPDVSVTARVTSAESEGIARTLETLLGTSVDLTAFYSMTRGVPLRSLAVALSGLKPPRYPCLFEALVNAVCCQQVNLAQGIAIMNRVAEMAGTVERIGRDEYIAFPAPEQLASTPVTDLRTAGLSHFKCLALIRIAEGFACGRWSQTHLLGLPTAAAVEKLCALPGIGVWSARYALLRGLGRLDVFPSGDSGAARTLAGLLGRQRISPDEAESIASGWKGYAGLLYFHLLGNRYLPEPREPLSVSAVPVQLRLTT